MATVPDTNTIIQVAIISQYLGNRAIALRNFYNNQVIDKRLPELIYITRKDVEWAYARNPSDTTLPKTGEYLFALCAPFSQQALTIINNLSQAAPVVVGTNNQSVLVGATATFSVSVTSALSVTYQWYRNGILILGATNSTYQVSNAQLIESGDTFYVRVANAIGTTQSATGILTVTAQIVGYFSYGDVDPAAALGASSDPFTYQTTFNITHNANLAITMPGAATPNKYLIVRVPIAESIKTNWFNTALNNGAIPDFNFQSYIQFGGNTYYYTRQALSMDVSQQLILS